MDKFFDALGRTIQERWKRENFSLAGFPEIARKALDENPPAKRIDLAKLIREFLLNEDQPPQTDSDFGEPELVAYSHPRFYIQLLFWTDGTTAIHQHEFSGAFHVMHGSSIHAHYEFDDEHAVTPYLRIGKLRMKEMELLEAGRTVPIASGPKTIHSLFHLDTPSVTVVVRTQHDPGTGPQLNYLPPGIAIDPHFSDKLTMRRKQVLDVLEQTEDASYAVLVMQMVSELDFERGFSILFHCMDYLQQLGQWQPALKTFEKKHRSLAASVGDTLKESVRRSTIRSMRSSIVEPEHRFFLALLMNAPTRQDLLALVAERFPDEKPVATVLRWVSELVEVSDQGVTMLDAVFPETLETEPDVQPELFLAAFEHFFTRKKNLPRTMRNLSASDLKKLRSVFAESTLSLLTL